MNTSTITTIVIIWVAITGVLSMLNKYFVAVRWPRVGAFLSSLCAVSPGDVAKIAEQIALLFAPAAALPAAVAVAQEAAAKGPILKRTSFHPTALAPTEVAAKEPPKINELL